MRLKKIIIILFAVGLMFSASACGGSGGGKEVVTVSYQYGIAYLPIQIVKDQGLIDNYYSGDTKVEWIILNSGQAVNEAFISGDIDVAASGVAPIITGVSKGVPYRIFSGISSQPIKLMTNVEGVDSLSMIGSGSKIGMGSLGSMQHIVLAMACEKELGDAHALDGMVMPLSHPDAMNALLTGSVDYHVATPPYLFIEEENAALHSIDAISEVWPVGSSFVVGVASDKFIEREPELYRAFVLALADAIEFINANPQAVAEKYCEEQGIDAETLLSYLNRPECIYDTQTKGVEALTDFMFNNGFIEGGRPAMEELFSEPVY